MLSDRDTEACSCPWTAKTDLMIIREALALAGADRASLGEERK